MVTAILAIGFLFLIIICQAALNLWFIFKNETLTKSSAELRRSPRLWTVRRS